MCRYLQQKGFDITYLPVQKDEMLDLEVLKKAIRPDTALVSVMAVNNEIGQIGSGGIWVARGVAPASVGLVAPNTRCPAGSVPRFGSLGGIVGGRDQKSLRTSLGQQALYRYLQWLNMVLYNDSTGVVQPLSEISRICRSAGAYLHTDAAQV